MNPARWWKLRKIRAKRAKAHACRASRKSREARRKLMDLYLAAPTYREARQIAQILMIDAARRMV